MSESEKEPIFFFKGDDPSMVEAYRKAQETFKYFWRELSWEMRRIVPGLDLACIKVPFSDQPFGDDISANEDVEHMWISDALFDGENITGVLINEPNWLKSISVEDEVTVPFNRITDWMYSAYGQVFGGFTVNVMRAGMAPDERAAHDQAWGLDFCNPDKIRICYSQDEEADNKVGRKILHYGEHENSGDHPMSLNMGESLEDQLKESLDMYKEYRGYNGFTMLHDMAMCGSKISVETLLKFGFDPAVKSENGKTAKDLSDLFKWDDVSALL